MSLNLADRFEQLPEMAGINHFSRVFKGHDYVNSSDVAILELLPSVLNLAGSEDVAWQSIERMWKVRDPSLIEKIALVKERNWVVVAWNPLDCSRFLTEAVQEQEVAQFMGQALLGLEAIHRAGLIHGDVKPASLLLDPKDSKIVRLAFSPGLYIGDLAIDREADQMHQAPELLRSGFGEPGPQTDLYCLAFTILQIAAGPNFTKAFASAGDTTAQWARWHGDPSKPLPPAAKVAPHLSESFASLLDTMLNKVVSARPESSKECQALLGTLHPNVIKLRADSSVPSKQDPSVIHKVADTARTVNPIPLAPKPNVVNLEQSFPDPRNRPLPALEQQPSNTQTNSGNGSTNSKKTANKAVVVASSLVAALAVAAAAWFFVLKEIVATSAKAPFVVSVLPADATISINGNRVVLKDGSAKLLLTPGDYSLKATKDGFDSLEEKFSIELPVATAQLSPERKIQLLESTLAIALALDPPDAKVLVDGKTPTWTSGKKPDGSIEQLLMLRPGKYSFTLQKEGYAVATLEHLVTQSTKQLKFDPLMIEVEIRVEPVDSTIVFTDAKPVEGKKNIFAVSQGKHQLKITHPGFETSNQEINVSLDKRTHEVALTPNLVQFNVRLPRPEIKIECEGKPLVPNSEGRYSLKPGDHTLAFNLGIDGDSKGVWEKKIKVVPNMLPVDVEIPESIAAKMAGANPNKGNQSSPNKSKLKDIIVRVFPSNLSNIKLVLEGNPIELSNGEATIAYADLQSNRKAIEMRVLRDNKTVFEEFIPRDSLESQGETAFINHSVSLSDKERARRLWLFARTAVKIVPKAAIEALDEALQLDTTLAVAYRERAIAKNELDLVAEAEEDVVRALDDLPNDYATLSIGGIVASKMYLKTTGAAGKANLSLATSRLNQAIEKYPKRTQARVMRSQLRYWDGDKKAAEEDLVALLGLTREPDQLSYVKSQLGTIASDAGKIDLAIQLFDEAIEIQKSAELSTTLYQFNKAKAILEQARRTQKENSNNARKFYELAKQDLLLLNGRNDLRQIPEFLSMLGEIEGILGNYNAAIKYLTNSINNGIATPKIFENRAAAFDAVGDKNSAEADRAKASQLRKK